MENNSIWTDVGAENPLIGSLLQAFTERKA